MAKKLKRIIGELIIVISAAFDCQHKALFSTASLAYIFKGTVYGPVIIELPHCCLLSLAPTSYTTVLISLHFILQFPAVSSLFPIKDTPKA
jgi:hypothetical protein